MAAIALGMTILVGCGAAAPAPSPTAPSAPPNPSGTAAPTEPDAPQPVLDLTCDDLATGSLSLLLPADGDRTPRDGGARVTNDVRSLGGQYSVRSAGGLACEWSNGQTVGPDGTPALVGVEIMILPNGTSQFERWIEYYQDGAASCRDTSLYCDSNELVGATWVTITASGTSGDAFASYVTEVRDLVASAGPGAELWTPPTALSGSTCDGIVTAPAVASALGLDVGLRTEGPHGGWSIQAAADENFGTIRCGWFFLDSDLAVGFLTALPGGAWAWDQAAGALTNPSTPAPLVVAGLTAQDEAWIRCADTGEACIVDLVLGDDWIEYRVETGDPVYTPTFDVPQGAAAIAAAIVAARP